MEKPLRILVVVNLPWDPRLGATRVWMELAEQWRAAGHTVEKFCLTDAYPVKCSSRPLSALRQVLFAYKAGAFVKANGHQFDVIDALIGTLPFSKRRLNFRGLLVARSVGLYLLYERFEKRMARKAPRSARGTFLGRIFYRQVRRRVLRDSGRAVRHADLINVPNEEEAACLREEKISAERIVVQPYGLTPDRARALAFAAIPPESRLARPCVSFVGMWSPRKGAHDWAAIIRAVRAAVPQTRFRFLGTMVTAQVIEDALGKAAENVECVSDYQPEELPGLLADCTVGAFPSYVEGFGLAVIEQLAAGLPTVAYETAGPRDILREKLPQLLVPCGQVEEFAAALVRVLSLGAQDYRALSQKSIEAANDFSWPRIAHHAIEIFRRHLRGVDSTSP
ncbi:MAG: glycosyltransferase family 4 protein [Chthoniobacterales bacterium]